ncbi:MAG: hypothetical protein AVDCRST_MAG93-7806, partial [uncultured Chloroflexia bacterium]
GRNPTSKTVTLAADCRKLARLRGKAQLHSGLDVHAGPAGYHHAPDRSGNDRRRCPAGGGGIGRSREQDYGGV